MFRIRANDTDPTGSGSGSETLVYREVLERKVERLLDKQIAVRELESLWDCPHREQSHPKMKNIF